MAIFLYEAKTQDGAIQKGRVEARDINFASRILQEEHSLIIVDIFPEESVPFYSKNIKAFQKVKAKDLIIFSRQLSLMVSSGVTLVEAVKIISSQTKSKYFITILQDIGASIDGGAQFSEALSSHEDVFSHFYIEMVKAGELSGSLDTVLEYLADYTEQTYHTNKKIKGAMTYPAFVIGTFILIGLAVFLFIIPQLASLLTESGQELPILTKIMLGMSELMISYWYLMLIGFLGFSIGATRFLKSKEGKQIFDRVQLRIPIFKDIFTYINVFKFLESLSILIKGGVHIADALNISSRIVGNTVYKEIILEARKRVIQGEGIAPTLASYEVLPPLLSQLFAVGEKTGSIDSILENLSSFYRQELSDIIDNITSIIQPILIVFLGAGVFIFMISVLIPIYSSVSTI